MNVLMMGLPFGADRRVLDAYHSSRGYAVRFLAIEGSADFRFSAAESAETVLTRVSREWPVDIFFCWLPELFPPPLEMERCPVKTVAAVSDWNLYFPQLEYNLARYDVVLTDKLGARILPLQGAAPRYLSPLYSHIRGAHRCLEIPRDIDILFAGNLNPHIHTKRAQLLEQIAGLSGEFRVHIGGGYLDEAYTAILNRARIVFNHSLRGEMNLRCFEALACGALLFLEEDNLEIRDWLRPGEELVLYREDNLLDLLRRYLENERERARIAGQGHARIEEIDGPARLDGILDFVAAQPWGRRTFETFPAPRRTLADIMQYGSSLVENQRVLARGMAERAAALYPRRPDMLAAAGALMIEQAGVSSGTKRTETIRAGIAYFQEAANRAPRDAALWLNLATVSRMAGQPDAEAACLENVVKARSAHYAALLLGRVDDPAYIAVRRAQAEGHETLEILRTSAAVRLDHLRKTVQSPHAD